MSILYSNLLLREGIAHNLLNANNATQRPQNKLFQNLAKWGSEL